MAKVKRGDRQFQPEIVCPHCGYIHSDSYKFVTDDNSLEELECGDCEKTFQGQRNVTVDYSSWKTKEDYYK